MRVCELRGHGSVAERVLAKHEAGFRLSLPAQKRKLNPVLPPGFEPRIAVPKTAVISVSPREQALQVYTYGRSNTTHEIQCRSGIR